MKVSQYLRLAVLGAASSILVFAQAPGPDDVVVSVMGRDFTQGEIDRLRSALPAQFKQSTEHMNNRSFLETFGYLQALATLAEKDGLLGREPFKSQFEFNRLNFLAQSYLSQINLSLTIEPGEKEAYYEANKDQFSQLEARVIAVAFDPIPEAVKNREPVMEQEAWEEAHQLMIKLREGADFAELAREHSDDAATAANGGALGVVEPGDKGIPEELLPTIFALKEGQFSEPVKNGYNYYIFQASGRSAKPYEEVQVQVLQGLQKQKLGERLNEIRSQVKVVATDPAYLDAQP